MKHIWILGFLAALLLGGEARASLLNFAVVCDNVTAANCVSVDASNTAPSGSELPLTVQNSILTKTLQSAAVANGNGTAFGLNGYSSAVLTVNCSSCSGGTTVNFEGSEDTSNWTALQVLQLGTSTLASNTTTAGVTVWQVSTAGLQQIRARVSAYSAGTVTVTAHAAQTPASYQVLLVSPTGQPTDGSTSTNQSLNNMSCWVVAALPTTNTAGQTRPCYSLPTGGGIAVTPVPAPGQGCTTFHIAGGSAASTNATNIKASAGTVCTIRAVNTTSTTYFLRPYNLSTTPSCNSSTGAYDAIPIPNNAGAGGGIVIPFPMGQAYSAGIGFCLTGGGADNDNTNAGTGVYVSIDWK